MFTLQKNGPFIIATSVRLRKTNQLQISDIILKLNITLKLLSILVWCVERIWILKLDLEIIVEFVFNNQNIKMLIKILALINCVFFFINLDT